MLRALAQMVAKPHLPPPLHLHLLIGYNPICWRGARVVEGNGLENRRASNGTVGSNPTLSAKKN
jgi:hypothetical protein